MKLTCMASKIEESKPINTYPRTLMKRESSDITNLTYKFLDVNLYKYIILYATQEEEEQIAV